MHKGGAGPCDTRPNVESTPLGIIPKTFNITPVMPTVEALSHCSLDPSHQPPSSTTPTTAQPLIPQPVFLSPPNTLSNDDTPLTPPEFARIAAILAERDEPDDSTTATATYNQPTVSDHLLVSPGSFEHSSRTPPDPTTSAMMSTDLDVHGPQPITQATLKSTSPSDHNLPHYNHHHRNDL